MERRVSANTVVIKTGYLSFMIEHVSVRVTVIYFGVCSFRHKYLSTSKSIHEITRNPRSNRRFVFVRVISWIISTNAKDHYRRKQDCGGNSILHLLRWLHSIPITVPH